jgi:hypothetical protein
MVLERLISIIGWIYLPGIRFSIRVIASSITVTPK